MLFDNTLSGQNLPDTSSFDNHINATLLPVKSVFCTLWNHTLFCTQMTVNQGRNRHLYSGQAHPWLHGA